MNYFFWSELQFIWIDEDPEHIPSLIEYAIILSLKGDYSKAKKYFKYPIALTHPFLIYFTCLIMLCMT